MKKLTAAAIIAAGILAAGTGASAANGDFVGYVYSTDILATVDGIPVTSYCLDGKTAVAVRDLESLGFNVIFYEDARIATVNTPWASLNASAAEVTRGAVGEIVGEIVESDIILYVNGTEVPCYNIGGRLVAAIEDLAPFDPGSSLTEAGFSETELAHAWDEDTRTIELRTLAGADNSNEAAQIAADNSLTLKIVNGDGRITFENNAYSAFSTGFIAGIANRYEPLYYTDADGTRTELGFAYISAGTVVTQPEVGAAYSAQRVSSGTRYCFDLDALEKICEANKGVHATIEDETVYWQRGGESIWTVWATFDADDYRLMLMHLSGSPLFGSHYQVLRLDKEPRQTVKISTEWMKAAELYDDTLYYFSGSGLYAQNVYETQAELVCEATDENIDAYLREHWEVLYEYASGDGHVYLLQGESGYRLYYVGGDYGIRTVYLDNPTELYAKGLLIVYSDGDGRKYVDFDGYVYDEQYQSAATAEVVGKGTQIL